MDSKAIDSKVIDAKESLEIAISALNEVLRVGSRYGLYVKNLHVESIDTLDNPDLVMVIYEGIFVDIDRLL